MNTPKLANPRLFFEEFYAILSLKFAFILFFQRKLCWFAEEICACFSSELHLLSMKVALTCQRNLHMFVDEIRASFCRDDISVSFFG